MDNIWNWVGWALLVSGGVTMAAKIGRVRIRGRQPSLLAALGWAFIGFVILVATKAISPDDGAVIMLGFLVLTAVTIVASIVQRLQERAARRHASPSVTTHAVSAEATRLRQVEAELAALKAQVAGESHTGVLVSGLRKEIGLRYRDSNGRETQRLVEVHQLLGNTIEGPVAISGFCHTRRAVRTFRIDRIAAAWAPTTGEVIADVPRWLGAQ